MVPEHNVTCAISRGFTMWWLECPSRVRDKPLKKAKQHGLFLGLDEYAWLDLLGQV